MKCYKKFENNIESFFIGINKNKLKRGIRHGQKRFNNILDRLSSQSYKYSLGEIIEDKCEPLESYYQIGKYISLANSFLSGALERGDIDMALAGAKIYKFLGQSQRKSVKRKIKKVYAKAKEMALEYDVPFYSKEGNIYSITPLDLGKEIEKYLP